MAQIGCYVPAESATLGLHDAIFTLVCKSTNPLVTDMLDDELQANGRGRRVEQRAINVSECQIMIPHHPLLIGFSSMTKLHGRIDRDVPNLTGSDSKILSHPR
jgi:hypothetical protein